MREIEACLEYKQGVGEKEDEGTGGGKVAVLKRGVLLLWMKPNYNHWRLSSRVDHFWGKIFKKNKTQPNKQVRPFFSFLENNLSSVYEKDIPAMDELILLLSAWLDGIGKGGIMKGLSCHL